MRTFCLATAALLIGTASAQPVEPVQLGGVSRGAGAGQIGFDFKLMGEGPNAGLPPSWGTLRTGLLHGIGGDFPFVSHYIYDSPKKMYYGYDVLIQKRASGSYLVSFGKLTLSPFELVMEIRKNPSTDWPMLPPSTNPADWTFEPLATYPPPQTVRENETIRIDLITDKDTGRKMYDNFQILPERGPARAGTAAGRANFVPPTVSGSARDFSAADAELQISQPRVTLNGTPQSTATRGTVNARGSLVWFHIPGHGRYILSLTPRPDLDFKLAGEVRGGAITFTLGNDSIKLECLTPIAPGAAPYQIYVLHDPQWESTAQAQKGQFAVGSVAPGELASLKRK